jgi:hypothetical protein
LQAPKRSPAGYYLALTPPVSAPALRWNSDGAWIHTEEWSAWATQQRKQLLGELLSHGAWFSKPPRHELLDPLFSPWEGRTMQGESKFFCKCPDVPGSGEGSTGVAVWELGGLLMTHTAITPIWKLTEVEEDEHQDTISLFGDADTVDDVEGEGGRTHADEETREIQFEDIEDAPAGTITHIRSREWEARKFLAKERVREARLKAQIASSLAEKEESRFYRQFGDFDDGESRFSDYDLTDDDLDSSDSSSVTDLEERGV